MGCSLWGCTGSDTTEGTAAAAAAANLVVTEVILSETVAPSIGKKFSSPWVLGPKQLVVPC